MMNEAQDHCFVVVDETAESLGAYVNLRDAVRAGEQWGIYSIKKYDFGTPCHSSCVSILSRKSQGVYESNGHRGLENIQIEGGVKFVCEQFVSR